MISNSYGHTLKCCIFLFQIFCMKRIQNLALGAVALISFSAYILKTDHPIAGVNLKKDFVRLNERLFVGKFEVSNGNYKKFMTYLQSTHQDNLYAKCLWDTAKWGVTENNQELKNSYHSRKAFDNYPVVTVSFEAANEYCKWLTALYNTAADRQFKKVVFRLPTEEEWIEVASGGNKSKIYPWDNFYLMNNKGEYLCNFLHLGDQSIYFDSKTKSYKVADAFIGFTARALVFNSVDALPPSPGGLFNMSGNAAEMVLEKGLAKGGSYNDPGYDVRISSKKFYDGPSTEIGFRVVMEVVE